MARKFRCPRPINRLVMMRTKGLSGATFQNVGAGVCVKGPGSYYGVGGPGSGPRATVGVVTTSTGVEITFSSCVNVSGLTGVEVQIEGGAWVQVTGETKMSDTVYQFVTPNIDPGDEVRWRYVGGSNTILDCDGADDIGDQEIPVQNSLALAGNFVLLSVGGKDVLLLSDDDQVGEDEAVLLSNAGQP